MASKKSHMESTIKREISKLYKSSFGKGPEETEVIIYENFVFLKFIGAFSQIEDSLMHTENGREIVGKIRDELILAQTTVYIPKIEEIVNEKVNKIKYIIENEKNSIYVFLLFANFIKVTEN